MSGEASHWTAYLLRGIFLDKTRQQEWQRIPTNYTWTVCVDSELNLLDEKSKSL